MNFLDSRNGELPRRAASRDARPQVAWYENDCETFAPTASLAPTLSFEPTLGPTSRAARNYSRDARRGRAVDSEA